jgi:CBS-domain-containing membrane protein
VNRLDKMIDKMKGTAKSPPRVRGPEVIWSWVGGFLGMTAIGLIQHVYLADSELLLVIAPFGASCVLLFGATKSPLAQPRNVLGGHVISALIGVAAYRAFFPHLWLAGALGVATAIAVMHVTKTLHPPAGATALLAVLGDSRIHALGFSYAVIPVGVGALVLIIVALVVNNLAPHRRFPEFWW